MRRILRQNRCITASASAGLSKTVTHSRRRAAVIRQRIALFVQPRIFCDKESVPPSRNLVLSSVIETTDFPLLGEFHVFACTLQRRSGSVPHSGQAFPYGWPFWESCQHPTFVAPPWRKSDSAHTPEEGSGHMAPDPPFWSCHGHRQNGLAPGVSPCPDSAHTWCFAHCPAVAAGSRAPAERPDHGSRSVWRFWSGWHTFLLTSRR